MNGVRRRVKRRNSNAKLTHAKIRAAYVLYKDGGLSMNELGAALWKRYGYATPDSCRRCLLKAFQLEGYELRTRFEADKLRKTPKNTSGLARHHQALREKTRCKNGHALTGENVYVFPGTGWRACRTCRREWNRARRAA